VGRFASEFLFRVVHGVFVSMFLAVHVGRSFVVGPVRRHAWFHGLDTFINIALLLLKFRRSLLVLLMLIVADVNTGYGSAARR